MAIVIFVAAVFESFVYLIGNGALDWGPVKRLRERSGMVVARPHRRPPPSAGSAPKVASPPATRSEAA